MLKREEILRQVKEWCDEARNVAGVESRHYKDITTQFEALSRSLASLPGVNAVLQRDTLCSANLRAPMVGARDHAQVMGTGESDIDLAISATGNPDPGCAGADEPRDVGASSPDVVFPGEYVVIQSSCVYLQPAPEDELVGLLRIGAGHTVCVTGELRDRSGWTWASVKLPALGSQASMRMRYGSGDAEVVLLERKR